MKDQFYLNRDKLLLDMQAKLQLETTGAGEYQLPAIGSSAGLYLHIPYCSRRCNYCNFTSGTLPNIPQYKEQNAAILHKYVMSLVKELEMYRLIFPQLQLATIYLGGGTPSLLAVEDLSIILSQIHKWQVHPSAEITMEINPDSVDRDKLAGYYALGVNRLSVGIQTLDDEQLHKLGRLHTSQRALECIHEANEVGFSNISADLIYGLPHQNLEKLQQTVEKLIAQPLSHISIYGLQLEPHTVLHALNEQGKLNLPTDEEVEKMYDYITTFLPQMGFGRYEISNFAKPGFESRHNLAYWQDKPYLGLGAGAHGYFANRRLAVTSDIHEYNRLISQNNLAFTCEEIVTNREAIEEYCFLHLRTSTGIDKLEFSNKFGKDIRDVYGKVIDRLIAQELMYQEAGKLALTALGFKYGNQVFAEFLLD